MIDNQLGRRNLTPQQQSYLRGKRYSQEKKTVSNESGVNQHSKKDGVQNDHQPKTAEKLAKQYGVSDRTIKNDEQFSKMDGGKSCHQPKTAEMVGVHETTMTKWLRTPLNAKQKQRVDEAIDTRF